MVKTTVLIFLLFQIFLGFVPYLATTPFGKKTIEEYLEKKLHTPITFSSIRLNWLGGQELHNVQIPYHTHPLECEKIHFHTSLFKLLQNRFSLDGSYTIESLKVSYPVNAQTQLLLSFISKKLSKTSITLHSPTLQLNLNKNLITCSPTEIHLEEKLKLTLSGNINIDNQQAELLVQLPEKLSKKPLGIRGNIKTLSLDSVFMDLLR